MIKFKSINIIYMKLYNDELDYQVILISLANN